MNIMVKKFKEHSQRWHTHNEQHDYRGRANVYGHFISRYGTAMVSRHTRKIQIALDNIEGLCRLD